MINCNPETVSTDFDTADKLYFEPVFWEHIYDIIEHEKPEGVIVQLGGQTALKLAEKLDRYGIKIMGTTYQALDLAEDRGSFSTLLKENKIPYPEFGVIEDADQAIVLSKTLGFPLLVRPSYVLGGQSMKIVINEQDLEQHVVKLLNDWGLVAVVNEAKITQQAPLSQIKVIAFKEKNEWVLETKYNIGKKKVDA